MTVPGGYCGKILNIDLGSGKWDEEAPDETWLRGFLGGYGLGARWLYERMAPGVDPYGPESLLGFVTGPLTGTPAIGGSRYTVVGKSPLTGGWGDANSGGEFGPALKYAGYDAVYITGIAPQPVYLLIDNGRVELHPAGDLWGLDTVETWKTLHDRHGQGTRVACIGPAGERLVRIAGIVNEGGRAAGRSGLGAVMGSKRLKAIAVKGSVAPRVADPERLKSLREQILPNFKTGETARLFREFGTPGIFKHLLEVGRTPIRNYGGTFPADFPDPDSLGGPAVIAHQVRRYACWHCPQACGGITQWEFEGERAEGHKAEYEALGLLGSNLLIEDIQAVMQLNEMCNRAGLDSISAGSVIAFAMECDEHGLFSPEELDGLTLEWGDGAAALRLVTAIIERRGLGDILAEGVMRAAQAIGRGSEAYAMHAGGQELPAHDPRHVQDFGLAYQFSPTPGRHTQGGVGSVDMPPDQRKLYGLAGDLEARDPVLFHALAYTRGAAFNNVVNAAGLCGFVIDTIGSASVPEFIAAVTGWDFDMPECLQTGERIEVMRYLYGLREGYNPIHAQINPRVMGDPPLSAGPTARVRVEIEAVRRAYMRLMEMDPVTAMPGEKYLASLGLDGLI